MEIEEAKRRAGAGPRILLARRFIVLMVTLVSTITVARLVPPEAYGLANMATVLLAFGQVFRDFGLTNAILRKGHISQDEMSFIFWFNLVMTLSLALLIALGAPAAARFYQEPIVLPVILCSLIGFISSGLALQHAALMNREFRFMAMAIIEISALFCGFLTTLTLAFIRHDVWAIVFGTVVQAVVAAVLYLCFGRWRPSWPKRPEDFGSLVRFGANTSIFSLSTFFSNNAAVLIIGHFLGAASLGQFNRAQALFALPNTNLIQPIAQATMPLLTRLRPHPLEYRTAYLNLVRKLCAFLMPLSVTLAFAAVPLVEWLLGDRWRTAGMVLSALAPALAGMGVAYSVGDLFITQDRSAELRTLGIVEMFLRVGSVVICVWHGLVAAAVGFTVSTLIAAVIRLLVAGRRGPVSSGDQLRAAAASLPILAGAGAGCILMTILSSRVDFASNVLALSYVLIGAVGSLLGGAVTADSRMAIRDLLVTVGLSRVVRVMRWVKR